MKTSTAFALLASGLLLVAGCSGTAHEGPATLAQARTLATERGVPILIDFYADW